MAWFSKSKQQPKGAPDEPLVMVPIPSLVSILARLQSDKGQPLTELEVLQARDKAVCVALPASVAAQMEASRGYRDIAPERAWPEWQAFCRSNG